LTRGSDTTRLSSVEIVAGTYQEICEWLSLFLHFIAHFCRLLWFRCHRIGEYIAIFYGRHKVPRKSRERSRIGHDK
jgi:hypothetical protein